MEEIDRYQSNEGNLPNEVNPYPHQFSTDVETSTNGTHFVCNNWVLCISIKRLKYLTRQFYLPVAIIKPGPNYRSHILPGGRVCLRILHQGPYQK